LCINYINNSFSLSSRFDRYSIENLRLFRIGNNFSYQYLNLLRMIEKENLLIWFCSLSNENLKKKFWDIKLFIFQTYKADGCWWTVESIFNNRFILSEIFHVIVCASSLNIRFAWINEEYSPSRLFLFSFFFSFQFFLNESFYSWNNLIHI
jgi:hypothetical protein